MGSEKRLIKFGLEIEYSYVYGCYAYSRKPAEFTFTVVNVQEEQALSGTHYKIFEKGTTKHYANTSIKDTDLLKFAKEPGDTLTVVCRVRELLSVTNDEIPIPPCQLQHDLENILNDPHFADVTLIVEGHNIKAHKAVLSARSPVFAAMFSSEMLEVRQNQVTIPDLEYKVAQDLLRFIYTGETKIEPDMADRLLVAADKYGLTRLKVQCEQAISKAISSSTAIKTLIFADRVNAEHLKSQAMAIIKANMEKVMESDDWNTMVVDHPNLLVEVCRTLAKK